MIKKAKKVGQGLNSHAPVALGSYGSPYLWGDSHLTCKKDEKSKKSGKLKGSPCKAPFPSLCHNPLCHSLLKTSKNLL